MVQSINSAVQDFSANLETVSTTALTIGGAALLVWVGWRLVCKLTNRGAGK